jgi:hypothetical protein
MTTLIGWSIWTLRTLPVGPVTVIDGGLDSGFTPAGWASLRCLGALT